MKLSKRKLKELQILSTGHDALQHCGYDFVDNHPEEWSNSDKQIYDLVNEVEKRMLTGFLEVLGVTVE
jgi:hypothetical protein